MKNKFIKCFTLFCVAGLCVLASGCVSAAVLEVEIDGEMIKYESSKLLESSEIKKIVVRSHYPGKDQITLKAVPIRALLNMQADRIKDQVVEFQTLDKHYTLIPLKKLLAKRGSEPLALLAIEPKSSWPQIPNKKVSAGPFYLVWDISNDDQSPIKIPREWWPYMVERIVVKNSLSSIYPKLIPKNKKLLQGMNAFINHCFACHSLNQQGGQRMGPDLNVPMGPTEYFKARALRRYIRSPESVRKWESMKMPSFPPEELNEKDLDALINYLKAMARAKN